MRKPRVTKPRRSPERQESDWIEMRRYYDLAEFDHAARVFDRTSSGDPPAAALLLRARLYLKQAPETAIAFLLRMPEPARQRTIRAEREMLLGVAYSRIHQHAAAHSRFDAAEKLLTATANLHAEIGYWRARDWILQGKPERAADIAAELARSDDEAVRIRAWQLLSAALRAQGRHREEAQLLIKVLDAIAQSKKPDIELRCWTTHTLAALTREIPIPEARRAVENSVDQPWPTYFQENHFQSAKAYSWSCALAGDYFNAFRYLKFAAKIAPGPLWTIIVLLDRAYLAKCIGETRWSRQELSDAQELLKDVDWDLVRGEERVAILLLAELLAPTDAAEAAYYMAIYQRLAPLKNPLLSLSYGARLAAIADYSSGVVHAALGNRKQGLSLLRKSLKIFDQSGYDWRAARCALSIYEVTRDPDVLEVARRKLADYTSSWLMEDLRRKESMAKTTGLTPAQEAIFHDICAGLSTDAIVEKYRRSKFTIRNHIKAILKEFNVKTRAALVAEASRRRLM